jgi:uncharacterized protein (DUF1015 family)
VIDDHTHDTDPNLESRIRYLERELEEIKRLLNSSHYDIAFYIDQHKRFDHD